MAQPKFVPTDLAIGEKYYESPPWRAGSWTPNRPGEVVRDGQPNADRMGSQGPDQGYAIKLARHLEPEVILSPGESFADALSGCVAVALKRASLYARGPMIHDVRGAFGLFGFFESTLPDAQIAKRKAMFSEVAHPHHYAERRAIADAVPESLLRKSPADLAGHASIFLLGLAAPSH